MNRLGIITGLKGLATLLATNVAAGWSSGVPVVSYQSVNHIISFNSPIPYNE